MTKISSRLAGAAAVIATAAAGLAYAQTTDNYGSGSAGPSSTTSSSASDSPATTDMNSSTPTVATPGSNLNADSTLAERADRN
ncbi:hypothetical protein [Roseateles asaccharophilus]|uniref:Type IV secretory pathway TrbL component n=1 Tax=Roseateles asaccharophilus TaxID=582607 RepID=A0ABU2A259_9BURK|nr:hypothetical protein [Roseateles asaccharophilus]MDR7331274.1 type IV secretory pathway TrbL component [Roseateles asaccharophilus]